jgi:LPS-assembly protein
MMKARHHILFQEKTLGYLHIPLIGILILLLIPVCGRTETDPELFRDDPNLPWHISADEIAYEEDLERYTAKGNVRISKGDKSITADEVRFDYKALRALAMGHVVMRAGEDVLTGTQIEVDLKNETGTIYEGAVFLKESHFYIKGNKIQKIDKETYTADQASISACDGEVPAWKITGKNLRVTLEGYAFVKHAALWAKSVPVLYSPFLFFPVKQKRQTGLLIPQVGYSDRNGAEYEQPFYWAVNDSSDATFYSHYMAKRGIKLGAEYRYVLNERSKGTLMADFLNDNKTDDGTADSEDWGYDADDVLRPNSDRYWFRMKHDQTLPLGISAKLDIDIVSDQDYLREFRDGYSGFDETASYFSQNFGRPLADYSDPVRTSSLSLNKTWTNYSLNLSARWYDNVILRRQGDTDTTIQQLPLIQFTTLKQLIPKTPLYWKLNSEYAYFYRKDGTKIHRADIYPRIYLPYQFKNYFTFEPSVGLRRTAWRLDEDENFPAEKGPEGEQTRKLYDIKLDLFSKLFKIYPGKEKTANGFKHTITPRIIYEYVDIQDKDEQPESDPSARIEKKNLITCSITNTLTQYPLFANNNDSLKPSEKDIEPLFCRFKLEQSYDISESQENDPDGWRNQKEKQHVLPLYGELELRTAFLSIQADAEWSFYDSEFHSRNIGISIEDRRGDRLFTEYRYTRDMNESLYADVRVKLSSTLSAYADYERNLDEETEIKSTLGMIYNAQCWSLDFSHTKESDDRRYALMISLYGLGGFGVSK